MTEQDREFLAAYYNNDNIKNLDLDTLEKALDMGIVNSSQGFIENNFCFVDTLRHKEIARQGGIASGRVRREKARQKEYIKKLVDATLLQGFITKQELDDFRQWQQHKRKEERKAEKRRQIEREKENKQREHNDSKQD